MNNRMPLAWPRARAGYSAEPEFHVAASAQSIVNMSDVLHAVASRTRGEYINALRMYCSGRPDLARNYLLRAEYVYKTYGTQENYDRVSAHRPDEALQNRGQAQIYAAWTELALHSRWKAELLQGGLWDLHQYLMGQSYDAASAYIHEDEDRLLTVLCQMALGRFDLAEEWLASYIKHRKGRQFKLNFPELLGGIQAQIEQGPSAAAKLFEAYFDQNRLGHYKFAVTQAFWVCVPMAILKERISASWQREPRWDEVLERLLY